jgi:hypothetical protein
MAFVNSVLNLQNPSNAVKFFSDCTTDGFSSSDHLHRVSQLISYIINYFLQ